jgi:hypothetical protein
MMSPGSKRRISLLPCGRLANGTEPRKFHLKHDEHLSVSD